MRILEGEEEAFLRALVGAGLDDVLAVEEDAALRDHVGRVAHERVGEGRLAGAVRAHHGVLLVQVDLGSTPLTISVPSSSATCRFSIFRNAKLVIPLSVRAAFSAAS